MIRKIIEFCWGVGDLKNKLVVVLEVVFMYYKGVSYYGYWCF